MAGNAHARRQRKKQSLSHKLDSCIFCKHRPKFGAYSNVKNGTRRNPHRNRKQKRNNPVLKQFLNR